MNLPTVTTDQWEIIQRQCTAFIKSGFLPNHIKTPEQAITIAWKGHELGIPPLQSFSSISVINGKPCLSAELMLALIYSRCKGAKITFLTAPDKQSQECTVAMQRPEGERQEFRFSIEDAKRAGLVKPGGAWEKYPAALLRARAVSAGARAVFPDCIMGCYTPEEMGADVIDVVEAVDVHQDHAHQFEPQPHGNTVGYQERQNAKLSESITEPQRKKLYAMVRELNWHDEDAKDWLFEKFGKKSTSELTKGEAMQAIDLLCSYKEASSETGIAG